MDTALNINGDIALSELGKPYRISGKDEIQQQLYILLSAKKGGFIYDRELGSDIFTVDLSALNCLSEIEAKARQALTDFPTAEIVGVSIDNGTISLSIELDNELYEIELRI